jgi:hypothetical protein
MDEEALNTSVREFLRKFGVMAQREFETAVRAADARGQLKGSDPLPVKAVVTVGGIDRRRYRVGVKLGARACRKDRGSRASGGSPLCSGSGAVHRTRFHPTEQLHVFVGRKNAARPNKRRHIRF